MISHKQRAMIQTARRQLGLSEDEYRGLLWRMAGVESTNDLTAAGFTALIRAFETLGFQRTNPPLHVRRGMATPAQLALVEQLWLDWAEDASPQAQRHWLERSFKISSLRFMTQDHAAMAINALRVMIRRKEFRERQAETANASGRPQTAGN